ncbi:MAG TPA: lytic transglycosylase domain-containing protein [Alphaproteobacteria bacterium]|nr:lytic transglycosylase domain-containing protein [Alphaproteobacteria bacterium]HNS44148.1 lytic transglycosylase domain-containing protein [Alphaproteobacteria bacterium]
MCGTAARAEISRTTAADAMTMMTGENWNATRAKVLSLNDPLLTKIYEWMLYREDYTGLPFDRIAHFIDANPHWPNQTALTKTAERNMGDNLPPQNVINWFIRHKPVSGKGAIRLLIAARQTGQEPNAVALLNAAWPDLDMTSDETRQIMATIGSRISEKNHRLRLDKLLFASKYTLARQYATYLGKGFPQLVEARIALAEDKPNAAALILKIPMTLRNDTGLVFERLSWRRRHDEDGGAIDILNNSPDIRDAPNANEWWKERNIMIRRMIEEKNFKAAYQLAARHKQFDKANKAEAEWLAGWISLRFLNLPQTALTHFTTMYHEVGTPVSLSRGSYWAGRAASAMNQKADAENWYKIAASYSNTYYGQLASKQLRTPLPAPSPQTIATPEEVTSIKNSDLLRTAVIANTAHLDSVHSQLITALIATLKTHSEFMAATEALSKAGDQTGAFRVAKAASWKNYNLGAYAFPSLEPKMRNISGDHALFHAIIRQESQFDTEARSPSGALGLMQLMPATAKETARKIGTAHQTGWLTTRPDHNILLGSTYLNGLLDRFDNALPLAIAGYNAGPSRVNGWIEEFGDPRTGQIDWVDWIELIPISETRNYVQRVSENYAVYRSR